MGIILGLYRDGLCRATWGFGFPKIRAFILEIIIRTSHFFDIPM